jgi:[ribosomal protein S18]-alanine N-acetyltransferase
MSAEMKLSSSQLPVAGLRIRPMLQADVPRVAQVEQGSYAFPWSDGIFRDCIRAGYWCQVAEVRAELIGHAVLSMGAGEAHILNVCVRLDFRDQGLGRFLVQRSLDYSRSMGMENAFLEVRPSNPAAIHLYESMGFARVGVRKAYYQASPGREDAWVYKLALGSG